MSRPWTRSMPNQPEEVYGTQTSNNSLRVSPVNRTAKQPCLKYAVSSNKASNSTKR